MRAHRANLFIKIPGTREGLPAIEEAIFRRHVPINVTLLFSREQYLAAARRSCAASKRRIAAGLKPDVDSVASLFVSRWDTAVPARYAVSLTNQLGIAISRADLQGLPRAAGVRPLATALQRGARPQRLLWASTGTKDPKASDVLYVEALAAPFTVNTIPEATLKAVADHGKVGATMPEDHARAVPLSPAPRLPASG